MSASFGVEEILLASIREIDSVYWFDEPEEPTVRNVVEHVRLIQAVDVSYPIILGPDGRVMDGMHRIARALVDGKGTINAVRFQVLPDPDFRNCRPDELPYTSAAPTWRKGPLAETFVMTPSVRAAVNVAREFGLTVVDPAVLQQTNNTVICLNTRRRTQTQSPGPRGGAVSRGKARTSPSDLGGCGSRV